MCLHVLVVFLLLKREKKQPTNQAVKNYSNYKQHGGRQSIWKLCGVLNLKCVQFRLWVLCFFLFLSFFATSEGE